MDILTGVGTIVVSQPVLRNEYPLRTYSTFKLNLHGDGILQGPQRVQYGKVGSSGSEVTARDIIIATGSVPFVPRGIEVDGKFSLFFPCLLHCCQDSLKIISAMILQAFLLGIIHKQTLNLGPS